MAIAIGLLVWAVGVVTDVFANPAFSAFWVLGHNDADNYALSLFGIAIILVVVFIIAVLAYRKRHGVALKE